ncbi:hypothetical protein CYMTET_8494 [Cymbomonas tetramitiformis]|uniref:Transmembrane protein 144 n=1 Tax=Cymbomonas tetramitiformis TaxID=36881 RepID=A0AAE0GTD5_9CHLO|nr:hypothetical protein CYMTET_8494 [Cymbomonas tetramitiformis]|eukprot:gene17715-21105_t
MDYLPKTVSKRYVWSGFLLAAFLLATVYEVAADEDDFAYADEVRSGRQLLVKKCSGDDDDLKKVSSSKGAIGYLFASIAILGFGSNFVPVKKVDAGDGVHFAAVMTTAVWLVGLIVQVARGTDAVFRPVAMLGGALWATGNVTVPIIVRCIGLGMGLLVWGLLNMLMGWSSGNFGLFGLNKQEVSDPGMNYAGVCLAVCSIGFFYFVETTDKSQLSDDDEAGLRLGNPLIEEEKKASSDMAWIDNLPPVQKKVIGFSLAMVAGLFYGVNFDPPQYLIDSHTCEDANGDSFMTHGYSHNSLDYVFSHFCGIFAATQVYFLLYCILKKGEPFMLEPSAYLPAIVSGLGWAISQVCWFLANDALEFVISFPIVTTGPGIIGAMWGIFLYGEIEGKRNFMFLAIAITFSICGVTLIALSK